MAFGMIGRRMPAQEGEGIPHQGNEKVAKYSHGHNLRLEENQGSVEFSPDTGRRRETEIATRDHRLAAAVSLQLLGLAFLGARVDLFRRKQQAQPGFTICKD